MSRALLSRRCLQWQPAIAIRIYAPLDQQLVKIESNGNPFAIGVVGSRLVRQPRNLNEAIATALALDAQGFNFSVGCRQINKQNFERYGLTIYSAFDPKINSEAGMDLQNECLERAEKIFGRGIQAKRAALSCYYSGNFTRGQQKEGNQTSYVDKVLGYAKSGEQNAVTLAIPVIPTQKKGAKKTHRTSPSQQFPLFLKPKRKLRPIGTLLANSEHFGKDMP